MASFHITSLYAGLLGLFLVVLSFNMTKSWIKAASQGVSGDPARASSAAQALRRAEALVGSFTDYVPLTLLLIGLAESGGAPAAVIHGLGAALVAARLMHAFGSNFIHGADALRFLGAQLTYLVLTIASFICLCLYWVPMLTH
ncbi:MAG: MAPEG family protein [Alphaproteobacteria bacterium]|nr:MAPEG family protein [Alphaproteobacteria bacterium]